MFTLLLAKYYVVDIGFFLVFFSIVKIDTIK